MQDGVVALLRADASLGTRFGAHASWWVRQAMQRLVSELTRPVVLSDRAERGARATPSAGASRPAATRRR
jgi:RNA polymerase primary sigma factor